MKAKQVEEVGIQTNPTASRAESFQHRLEQFNPGVVWLDRENRISALNDVALQTLGMSAQQSFGVDENSLIGINVLQLHPEHSREKLRFLLGPESGAACPAKSPPPMTMMINTPDRILMIKVAKMFGNGDLMGTCMVFYDITDLTTTPVAAETSQQAGPRRLFKIPVYRRNRIVLVDVASVIRFEGDGHYTNIITHDDSFMSNLSLSDLDARLDPETYMRVHRSHIINLRFAVEIVRGDDSVSIVMDDTRATAVPVSRSRAAHLKQMLGIS